MADVSNVSAATVFTLSAFNETRRYRVVIFALSLLFFTVILFVNVSLIMIIISDENLHEPMYILVCVFCMNGVYGSAAFYPKFLCDLLSSSQVISRSSCLCQAFVMHSFSCTDTSVLAVMAYDRYLAICRPLQYHSIMTRRRLSALVCFALIIPFCVSMFNILLTSRLTFCGSDIQRLVCVNWLIVKLACPNMDTSINNAFVFVTLSVYSCHGCFIVWTYLYLVHKCVKSKDDRAKFMQTCLPNLISLVTFFVTGLLDLINSRLASGHLPGTFQNFIAVTSVVVPPVMNPLLYGFKMTKIRSRILVLACVSRI